MEPLLKGTPWFPESGLPPVDNCNRDLKVRKEVNNKQLQEYSMVIGVKRALFTSHYPNLQE